MSSDEFVVTPWHVEGDIDYETDQTIWNTEDLKRITLKI